MTNKRAYAGIGSRETPADILELMTASAQMLEDSGLILRSGAADGADSAFEAGVSDPNNKQIFIPWGNFNKRRIQEKGVYILTSVIWAEAFRIAAKHHPAWAQLSGGARELHTRNVAQVLGPELNDPSLFILCWTKGGKGEGGTGQALRIANTYGVPIFDMGCMSLAEIEIGVNRLLEQA